LLRQGNFVNELRGKTMEIKQINSTIKSRAAVAFAPNQPLQIVEIDVEMPRKGEVLIRNTHTGVCHTDAFTLSGSDPEGVFPVVLGHEGAGVVVAVGEGVLSVKPGDHVIPLYTAECGECEFCRSGKTNLCVSVRDTQGKGLMPDGTTRFSYQGQPIYHYMGCSTFSEYSVVAEVSLAKINPEANHEQVCLLGCGVTTGIGAVHNTAKVQEGDSVAVFGLGAIGLAVVQGARQAKAGRIIAIDTNPSKFELAKQFGATDCLNPNDYDKPIKDVLLDINKWGIDHTFECIGNVNVMRQALESAHRGWGQSIIIGVAGAGQEISTRPFQLVTGRVWKGSAFGGVKGRSELPKMVEDSMKGDIQLEPFVTHTMTLEQINEAFELMLDQTVKIRGVIDRIDRLSDGSLGIVDYKSSKNTFDLQKFYNGLSPQLVTYIEALRSCKNLNETDKIFGAMYLHMQEPKTDLANMKSIEKIPETVHKNLSYKGLFLP